MDVRLESTGLKCIENPNVCTIEEPSYFTPKKKFNWTTGIYLLFVRSEENFWKLPLPYSSLHPRGNRNSGFNPF